MNLYKITPLVYMYASISVHKETLTWVVFFQHTYQPTLCMLTSKMKHILIFKVLHTTELFIEVMIFSNCRFVMHS